MIATRGLPLLTIALVVVTACTSGGQLDGEAAARLEISAGSQHVWCVGQGPGVVLV